ncbi:MAG: pyridoxal-phosphate dependent enzyme, partial [Gammaproteobacteria bacterium]
MISPLDIEAAAARIAPHVRVTPVIALEPRAFGSPARVVLKLELMQHTGSFKPRGAFNRILASSVPDSGVIAASGGNHGAAVAYAARQLGHVAEIFVPEPTPDVKVERLRRYGARVVLAGANYAEAYAASGERARETGALEVHAYDQAEVLAGQGTLARELERQTEGLDTVLV